MFFFWLSGLWKHSAKGKQQHTEKHDKGGKIMSHFPLMSYSCWILSSPACCALRRDREGGVTFWASQGWTGCGAAHRALGHVPNVQGDQSVGREDTRASRSTQGVELSSTCCSSLCCLGNWASPWAVGRATSWLHGFWVEVGSGFRRKGWSESFMANILNQIWIFGAKMP